MSDEPETPKLHPYPAAPVDKDERRAYMDRRNAAIQAATLDPPSSGTFGAGKPPG